MSAIHFRMPLAMSNPPKIPADVFVFSLNDELAAQHTHLAGELVIARLLWQKL